MGPGYREVLLLSKGSHPPWTSSHQAIFSDGMVAACHEERHRRGDCRCSHQALALLIRDLLFASWAWIPPRGHQVPCACFPICSVQPDLRSFLRLCTPTRQSAFPPPGGVKLFTPRQPLLHSAGWQWALAPGLSRRMAAVLHRPLPTHPASAHTCRAVHCAASNGFPPGYTFLTGSLGVRSPGTLASLELPASPQGAWLLNGRWEGVLGDSREAPTGSQALGTCVVGALAVTPRGRRFSLAGVQSQPPDPKWVRVNRTAGLCRGGEFCQLPAVLS